jgi:hypothetical protein
MLCTLRGEISAPSPPLSRPFAEWPSCRSHPRSSQGRHVGTDNCNSANMAASVGTISNRFLQRSVGWRVDFLKPELDLTFLQRCLHHDRRLHDEGVCRPECDAVYIWYVGAGEASCSGVRPFVNTRFSNIVCTFRDGFRRIGIRPRDSLRD